MQKLSLVINTVGIIAGIIGMICSIKCRSVIIFEISFFGLLLNSLQLKFYGIDKL